MASPQDNLIGSWDWANKHVQPRDQVSESRFVNGATVLISAGPPRLVDPNGKQKALEVPDDLSGLGNLVFPIGVCMDASIQQQRALQRIYEVGSDRCYFVQGRSSGGINLNRVLFNGANVLRVLYAYYPPVLISQGAATQNASYADKAGEAQDSDNLSMVAGAASKEQYTGEQALPQIVMQPGANNFFVNLASDLFNHPLGLMFTFQDIHKHTFASFYCEMVYVNAHGMSISGNAGSIVAESVQMQFDRIAPIQIT